MFRSIHLTPQQRKRFDELDDLRVKWSSDPLAAQCELEMRLSGTIHLYVVVAGLAVVAANRQDRALIAADPSHDCEAVLVPRNCDHNWLSPQDGTVLQRVSGAAVSQVLGFAVDQDTLAWR